MRIFIFITLIMVLIIGWCLGWFFVSGKVEEAIATTKEKLAENGQTLDCAEQVIDGFPFRISLNCQQLVYVNPGNQVALETGSLKSAAQAYEPNKMVAEVESPAILSLPGSERYQLEWQSMRSSLMAGFSGPDRFSLDTKAIKIIPENPSRATVDIAGLQVHGRRNGEEAVDFALSIDDATTQRKPWPDYDLNLDIRLDDIYSDLLRRTDFLDIARQKGIKGELYNLKYTALEGGSAELKGPITIDRNGILSGKFEITVSQLPKILDALSRAFPKYSKDIQQAALALSAIAGSRQNDEFTIPVTVKDGRLIIGIFPVAKVPQLY